MVGFGLATSGNLLLFTFLIGAAGALTVPAWQAVVPLLVPKDDLPAGIAANSVGVNISRAIGPAIGGVAISGAGIVAPFWLNAVSNLGIVGALLWWREPKKPHTLLPAERFGRAIWTGPSLRKTQFASAWHFHAGGRLFSVRQRLLGTAATGRAQPDRGRPGPLWRAPWRYWGRRGRRCLSAAVAEVEARAGSADGG